MKLPNKTAIITGASGGLGEAIAAALIAKKTEVYGIARNQEKLKIIQKQLGPLFHPVPLDITNGDKLTRWIVTEFDINNPPDILINNAGLGSFGKIDKMPTEEWLAMMDVNVKGMYLITSALTPFFKQNPYSTHIINIGSILATTARAEGSAYCATKYAVRGFSEALFKELRSENIKVTCVNPGSINTSFFKSSNIKAHQNMLSPKDLANTIVHILETPDNMLINEITIRPLDARKPS
ncbi:MAG TPA: SDR family oxidoreductase [Flavobacteriaceae bacterium]|nr:SDR family oxidoreductase [Flavobacteriaceae bacterium]